MSGSPTPAETDVEATPRVAGEGWRNLKEYLLYRRHLFAYQAAIDRAGPGGAWIDIGCGMGYSLARLAARAERVLALDLAWTALRALPDAPGLHRARADATRIPLADASVDHVLCFQVLEHVETPLALRMLCEIRRVLRPQGTGYLTTPNARWRLLPGQAPSNPHHVVEYRPEEIVALCQQAGIGRDRIRGVLGRGGAQEVEQARVAKHPLLVWGPHSPRAWSQWARHERPPGLRAGRRLGRRPVRPEDEAREWFGLAEDFAEGLDFWIEVPAAR